jgi:hypothetical protein
MRFIPDGAFDDCMKMEDSFPREKYPRLYLSSYIGLFRRGVQKYGKGEFLEAMNLFIQSSQENTNFTAAFLGQAFLLFSIERIEESSRAFSEVPVKFLFSLEKKLSLPPEWLGFEGMYCMLDCFYLHASRMYSRGAFEEALKRVDLNLRICKNHLLSLDLKYKCLWKCLLNRDDFRVLWKCGVQLKGHMNEENISSQKLSLEAKQMIQETIKLHLRLSETMPFWIEQ